MSSVEPIPSCDWTLTIAAVNFAMFGVWFSLAIPAVLAIKRRMKVSMTVFVCYFVYLLCILALYCVFIVSTTLPTVFVLHRTNMSYLDFIKSKSLWFWMVSCNGIFSDGLFTYQCWIICNRSRWIAIPLVLHVTCRACLFASDILLTVQHDWSASLYKLAITGVALELAAHAFLLFASVKRLIYLRREARIIGTGSHYITLAKILAASEFVYMGLSISPLFTMNELIYIVRFATSQIFPLFILINAGKPMRVESKVDSSCMLRMTLGDRQDVDSKLDDGELRTSHVVGSDRDLEAGSFKNEP